MLEQGIYQRLTGATAISDLVGDRVYPAKVPQNTDVLPWIEYERNSGFSDVHFLNTTGSGEAYVFVNCYDKTYQGAADLGEVVRVNMLQQTNGQGFWGPTLYVMACIWTDFEDIYFPPVDASDRGRYLRQMECQIQYREPIPT